MRRVLLGLLAALALATGARAQQNVVTPSTTGGFNGLSLSLGAGALSAATGTFNAATVGGAAVLTGTSDVSSNPSTSTGATASMTQAARGAYVYHVEDFETGTVVPGTTDETAALASAEAAAALVGGRVQLKLRSYYLAGGATVPSLVNVSGDAYPNFSSPGGIDGVALNAPQLILASGTQETISAASYNSTTGLVTLTLAATPSGLTVGTAINVYGVMGTGDYLAADGQYTAAAGTTGNTVTYTIPTNLTLTLASAGTLDYGGASLTVNGTLRNVAVVRSGTNLNARTLSACLANESNMNGRGISVGNAAVVEHVMLFGHAVGIYTNNAASWHIDDVRADNLAGVNITGMHQYSSINNVHNEPILAYGCGGDPTFAITGVADNGSGVMRVTTSTPHGLIANQRVVIAGVQGVLSANWAWVVTPIDATHFDLTKRADDGSPGLLAPTVTATLTAGSVTIPLSSMDGIADGQTISGSGITGTPAIVNQSVPLSQIALANGGSVTATGVATLTINNSTYVANTGTLYVSSGYRPGPCLYVQNSESPMGAVYTCHGYGNLVTLDSQAGWLKIAGLSLEADVYGPYDPTSVAITLRGNTVSGSPYGSSFDVDYFGSWTALKVASGSSKTQHFNGGEMYDNAVSTYGPPGVEILSGHVELNGMACGGGANSFFVSASATLNLNGVMCENSYWAYGSAFSNAVVTGSTFSDLAGNTVRGPTVSLAVPNAAGTGFQQALIASGNGVQFATPPLTVATLPTCNGAARGLKTAVSDAAATPTYIVGQQFGTPTGGGSIYATVLCTGVAWVYN